MMCNVTCNVMVGQQCIKERRQKVFPLRLMSIYQLIKPNRPMMLLVASCAPMLDAAPR